VLEAYSFYTTDEPKKKKIGPVHMPDWEGKKPYKNLCMNVNKKIKGECSQNVKRSYKPEAFNSSI
jgi:hypothetical protein